MKRFGVRLRAGRIAIAAVVLLAAGAAFSGLGHAAAGLFHLQFGPALLRMLAAFSAGALATVLGIALGTLLFGRFYCAMLCPLGALQDAIGRFSRRRKRPAGNPVRTRYAIAGIVCGMAAAGAAAGFGLLDPYSNFGRITASVSLGGLAALTVVAGLAIWKKRLFCTAICPVGTLLGMLAGHSLFRLAVGDRCVRCGQCATHCPAGCLDPAAGTLDNERCVRCLNCMAACPRDAIRFVLPKSAPPAPVDPSRRAFLINGAVLLAGAAAGAALTRAGVGKLAAWARRFRILPPGAGDAERFAARCTGCQLCAAACPTRIIVPAPGGIGPVSLDLSRGACRFDCNRCTQLCPTGALRPLTPAEKQQTRIAEAAFLPQNCIVFQQDEPCGRCAAACPAGAITLRANGTPRPVDRARCIGCGACQAVCPAVPGAMTVRPVERQSRLTGVPSTAAARR